MHNQNSLLLKVLHSPKFLVFLVIALGAVVYYETDRGFEGFDNPDAKLVYSKRVPRRPAKAAVPVAEVAAQVTTAASVDSVPSPDQASSLEAIPAITAKDFRSKELEIARFSDAERE